MGMLTSELPLVTVAWQVVATLFFIRAGALRAWPGILGVVLSLASWAVLVRLHREAQRSRAVLEDALVAALGPDYAVSLPDRRPADELPLTRRQIALPRRGDRRYRQVRDVPYADGGKQQQLDVW